MMTSLADFGQVRSLYAEAYLVREHGWALTAVDTEGHR